MLNKAKCQPIFTKEKSNRVLYGFHLDPLLFLLGLNYHPTSSHTFFPLRNIEA